MTTWVKVYDTLRGHRKSLQAGGLAMWLYVCGLSYANEQTTDGFIPRVTLPAVAPGVKSPEKLAARLVDADLWHVVDGGWMIHDYLDAQRSAEEIRDRRAKDAERKAAVRNLSARTPQGVLEDENGPSDFVRNVDTEKRREETELASSRSKVVSLHERSAS